MSAIATVALPGGEKIPKLGFGTWRMGEDARLAAAETAAVKLAIELGMSLIDTAEMYGEGGAERIIAPAIAGRAREHVFLVSKVYPHNASRSGTVAACERSLKRLGTDRIDLYLLHWPGSHPLEETVAGFERLRAAGKIRHWGVSNFDLTEMDDLWRLEAGGACATNQVLYNLGRRGIEHDLLPALTKRGLPVMAYTPLEPGRLARQPALEAVAKRHGVKPLQVALAWLLRREGVIAIPKATNPAHLRENRAARDLTLEAEDLALIDRALPPPKGKRPLEML
ncbi:MAG: aldo/keto reductase [Alphaproteobacteria bacterium]|nr:aldo/keto reductase [Alphaproteobacteria bacterium]